MTQSAAGSELKDAGPKQTDRRTDGQIDDLADAAEWPGKPRFCFCVGITQTLRSDHHTNRGAVAYTELRSCCVGD